MQYFFYLVMFILGLSPTLQPSKPVHFDIEKVIRPNILFLQPYRAARDDYQEGILLDANENALRHSIPSSPSIMEDDSRLPSGLQPMLDLDLNRYPDPSHPVISLYFSRSKTQLAPIHLSSLSFFAPQETQQEP